MYSGLPTGDPRTGHPSVVILTMVSSNISNADERKLSLVTSHVFCGLTKYPKEGPTHDRLSHHFLRFVSFPPAEASSAYQICLSSGVSLDKTNSDSPPPILGHVR